MGYYSEQDLEEQHQLSLEQEEMEQDPAYIDWLIAYAIETDKELYGNHYENYTG